MDKATFFKWINVITGHWDSMPLSLFCKKRYTLSFETKILNHKAYLYIKLNDY